LTLQAQDTVPPVTRWLATVVDDQIILSWNPSVDTHVMGYHICTGIPCLDYDTVFGRNNSYYICADHDPSEQHTYRIHVFDSTYNTSALTPSFGNIVLSASVPQCSTEVTASWTPYEGMPEGVDFYQLWVRLEPLDDEFSIFHSVDSAGPLTYQFDIDEHVTRVWLKVHAVGFADPITSGRLVSQSNVVAVERLTIDSAAFLHITSATYDSASTSILLSFATDNTYHPDHYTLWRSIDGRPWRAIATLPFPLDTYTDYDVNPFDSLHCYRLSVTDACDMNEKYSATQCVVTPDPPSPVVAIPNTIIVGDSDNGTFLPHIRGLKDDLFEMYIYNRQGILVYQTTDPTAGWTPAATTSQGVYTYAIRCRYNNNIIKTHTGTILVLK
jgi:hypothetical protein